MLFLGYGATIPICSLLNILSFRGKIPFSVLEIVDCQGHLSDGRKIDGSFICNWFLNNLKEVDLAKKFSDIVTFDGSLNGQIGARLLKLLYPKFTVMRGVEHTVSLFFNDVF